MSNDVAERQEVVAPVEPWPVMAFSEAVAINPKRPLPKSGDVPFLDMAALPLHGAPVSVVEKRPVASGGARFQGGDTLFARITPCAENGKLGYVSAVAGGTTAQGSTEFVVMGARDGLTLPEYVRWLSGWSFVRDLAIGLMEGTSGRQRIPAWAFDEIEVPVPPLDEQRRIAEVLRSVDEAIAAASQVIAQANDAFDAVLTDLFSCYGDASTKLESYCLVRGLQTGPFGSQLKAEDYVDDGVPVIMPVDLTHKGMDFAAAKKAPFAKSRELARHILRPGDVLFARRGEIGRCGLYLKGDPVAMCGTGCLRARLDTGKIDPALAYFLIQSRQARDWLCAHAVGATMPNLNTTIIGELPMPDIPKTEQGAWVDALLMVEGTRRINQSALALHQVAKANLMSDLLSGRVRVPA